MRGSFADPADSGEVGIRRDRHVVVGTVKAYESVATGIAPQPCISAGPFDYSAIRRRPHAPREGGNQNDRRDGEPGTTDRLAMPREEP